MVRQRGQGRGGSSSPCPATSRRVQVPSTGTPTPAMLGGGNCRRNFCTGCSFIHTIFRRQRDFWTSCGWITTTSAVAVSWITPLFFLKITTGASGTAIFSSSSRDSGYALKICQHPKMESFWWL